MFKTDSGITQPDDKIYIIIQPEDSTKCEGKVSPNQLIISMLTSSQMMPLDEQSYAMIQPDDNINFMICQVITLQLSYEIIELGDYTELSLGWMIRLL
jgi:hypothetical protein